MPDRRVCRLRLKQRACRDRSHLLPAEDLDRGSATHIPETLAFATKPQLALTMIRRSIAADVPFSWVVADSTYGVGEIGQALRQAAKGYVLEVGASHRFNSWIGKPDAAGTAEAIADAFEPAGLTVPVGLPSGSSGVKRRRNGVHPHFRC